MTAAYAEPIERLIIDDGVIDAGKLADLLGQKQAAMARALGVKPDTLRHNPTTKLAQRRAWQLIESLNELVSYFQEWKYAKRWLNVPNQELDDEAPLDVILKGEIDAFAGIVRMIGTGQPT